MTDDSPLGRLGRWLESLVFGEQARLYRQFVRATVVVTVGLVAAYAVARAGLLGLGPGATSVLGAATGVAVTVLVLSGLVEFVVLGRVYQRGTEETVATAAELEAAAEELETTAEELERTAEEVEAAAESVESAAGAVGDVADEGDDPVERADEARETAESVTEAAEAVRETASEVEETVAEKRERLPEDVDPERGDDSR